MRSHDLLTIRNSRVEGLWKTKAIKRQLICPQCDVCDKMGLDLCFPADLLRTYMRFAAEVRKRQIPGNFKLGKKAEASLSYYISNLSLYTDLAPNYIETAVRQLAYLCSHFNMTLEEVLANGQCCVSNKGSLYQRLGEEAYYLHPIYLSHLWIENVNPRRVFFVSKVKDELNKIGVSLADIKVLDVGCGLGGTLHLFGEAKEKVGTDLSPTAIKVCQATKGKDEQYETMNCLDLRFSENTFNLITCLDVLEHVPHPRQALKEMARVLKERSFVAIVYPFGDSEWDSHISLVGKAEFEVWIREAGFGIVSRFTAPKEEFPCSICYVVSS